MAELKDSETTPARRVVVTGASSGIGAAVVRLFRQHGWQVVAVARRADRLAALAAETGAEAFVADVTSDASVEALRAHLAGSGGVDALVNNAGGARGSDTVEAGSVADWQWMFEVNVLGTKRVTAALLPLLRAAARGRGSADVLTVTSTAGLQAYAGGGGYNAAKFAEHALVGALRLELAGEPIRVLEVAPGMVHTPEFSLNRLGDQAKADAIYAGVDHPLQADDVAAVIVGALEAPWHVNQDLIVVRPVAQAAQFRLHKGPLTVAD